MRAIRGRIVPLSADPAVAPNDAAVFTGGVWVADDGTVAAVTKGSNAGPPGSGGAQVIDVGSSLVMPGLIDQHNHLAYNTLPLWTEPGQQTPFAHHNSWTRAETYAVSTTWPAYALITACPQELLAYVEAKAIVGGTTSIQGSPPKNRRGMAWLVRNIEDETFGSGNANLIYTSVLTAKPAALAERANKMRSGSAFIYHCSEGQRGSIVGTSSPTPTPPDACNQGSSRSTPMPSTRPSMRIGSHPERSPGRHSPICGSTARPPMCRPGGGNQRLIPILSEPRAALLAKRAVHDDHRPGAASLPRGDLPFGVPSWPGDDARGRQSHPKRRKTVERDPADLVHTLIWRAPAG